MFVFPHRPEFTDSSGPVEHFLAKVITASRFLDHSCIHIKNTGSLIHIGAGLPPLASITYPHAEALRPPVVSPPQKPPELLGRETSGFSPSTTVFIGLSCRLWSIYSQVLTMLEAPEPPSDQTAPSRLLALLCSEGWVPVTSSLYCAKWSLASSTDQLKESLHLLSVSSVPKISAHVVYSYGLSGLNPCPRRQVLFLFQFHR